MGDQYQFLDGKIVLYPGDCMDALRGLPAASVDSVVCDPPYHLTSIVKRYGADDAAPTKAGKTGVYARGAAGFMGKKWDGGDIAQRVELWTEVLRVLKPGAHLIAFSGTRTYHRMACAIEDAGFEIRDQIGWCYGSGFPKSHDVSKGIDARAAHGSARTEDIRRLSMGDAYKPSEDRLGSKHPTVKPLDLMQWLVRLVTPKGGVVLDPFAGTGTTGEAAWREGMRAILIEREEEYQEDIARRMDLATKPTKRAAVAASKGKLDKAEDLPLFAKPAL